MVEPVVEITASCFGCRAVVNRTVEGLLIIVEQSVSNQKSGIPVLGILEIRVAGIIPSASTPIVASHVIGSVLAQEEVLPAAKLVPDVLDGLARNRRVTQRKAGYDRQG